MDVFVLRRQAPTSRTIIISSDDSLTPFNLNEIYTFWVKPHHVSQPLLRFSFLSDYPLLFSLGLRRGRLPPPDSWVQLGPSEICHVKTVQMHCPHLLGLTFNASFRRNISQHNIALPV